MLEPKEGLLTFRAEGDNFKGSLYYSRTIHWPGNRSSCAGNASGVTIGRGFDMGNRTKAEVYNTLIMSGVPSENARKIADGAGLRYCRAMTFVINNKEIIKDITEGQQLVLFNITYADYLNRAKRFYYRRKGKGAIEWEKLDQKVRDVFVDMFYQGRLNPERVKYFEKNNKSDITGFIKRNKLLSKDEPARNRIDYLLSKGK